MRKSHLSNSDRQNDRSAAAIDFFVILLAMIGLLFWALGHVYLSFYPSNGASSASAGLMSNSATESSSLLSSSEGSGSEAESGSVENNAADSSNDFISGGVSGGSNSASAPDAVDSDSAELAELTASNKMSAEENRKLKTELSDLRSTFDTYKKEQQMKAADASLADSANDNQVMVDENRDLKKRLVDLQASFDGYKQQQQAASATPASSDGSDAKQLADLEQQLAAAEKRGNDFDKQLSTVNSQLTSLQQQLQSEKQRSGEFEQSLSVEQNRVELLTTELSTQSSMVEQLKTDLQQRSQSTGSATTSKLPAPLFRQWTGKNGRTIEMAFIRRDADGQFIFIDRKNQLYSVPQSRLLAEDLKLLESASK